VRQSERTATITLVSIVSIVSTIAIVLQLQLQFTCWGLERGNAEDPGGSQVSWIGCVRYWFVE
jgi:hypothetical protein